MASRTVFTPQRWKQVEDLFLEATALEGPERVALLDRRCGTDIELRTHVERMLAGHAPQDTFLESPHTGGPRPGLALGTENLVARHFGHSSLADRVLETIRYGVEYRLDARVPRSWRTRVE